jgi:hypothetical protein
MYCAYTNEIKNKYPNTFDIIEFICADESDEGKDVDITELVDVLIERVFNGLYKVEEVENYLSSLTPEEYQDFKENYTLDFSDDESYQPGTKEHATAFFDMVHRERDQVSFDLDNVSKGKMIKFGTITTDTGGQLVFSDFQAKNVVGRCDLFIIDQVISILEQEKKRRLSDYLPGYDSMGHMRV